MRQIAVCVSIALWAGCGARRSEPLSTNTEAVDAGAPPSRGDAGRPDGRGIDAGYGQGGAAGQAAGGSGGVLLTSLPSGDPPSAGAVPICPATADPQPDAAAPPEPAAWNPPTAVPFSCDAIPNTFYFPRPTAAVPGVYARCASFPPNLVQALAVSPDGTRVGLVGADGVVRVVDVASRSVVGLLAPPRDTVTLAAFSPDGNTIATIANGERVVTMWRADTFTPIWSTTLPGHPYARSFNGLGGAVAFSPDETAILISPGADLFLLDAATGSIVATREPEASVGAVVTATFGLNGSRIVVEEDRSWCGTGQFAGSVTVLDPQTLSPLVTPLTWSGGPAPGEPLVATGADLMLIRGPVGGPAMMAYRVSDGTPLPAPPIESALLVTPDGTAVLAANGDGQLTLARVADGTVLASTAAAASPLVAMSGNGKTIVLAPGKPGLLGIWHPGADSFTTICSSDGPLVNSNVTPSPDGQMIAVVRETQIQLLQRADGALLSTISQEPGQLGDWPSWDISFSSTGRYVLVTFFDDRNAKSWEVFRSADGRRVVTLDCGTAAFSSDDTSIDTLCLDPQTALMVLKNVSLSTGLEQTQMVLHQGYPSPPALVGLSDGCPVFVSATNEVAWRACGVCSDPPFATGTARGLLSLDGTAFLGTGASSGLSDTTLWQVLPTGGLIRRYPARSEEATWSASEQPVAISAHGERVITTARANIAASCGAPGFTSRVHDTATDGVVDELPSGITATSADLSILAYGNVLWCRR